MIRSDWYRQAMAEAGIPVSRHEDEIIREMEHNGKFNEIAFIHRVDIETPIFLTSNQVRLIRLLAHVDSEIKEVGRKNGVKKQVQFKKDHNRWAHI